MHNEHARTASSFDYDHMHEYERIHACKCMHTVMHECMHVHECVNACTNACPLMDVSEGQSFIVDRPCRSSIVLKAHHFFLAFRYGNKYISI